MLVAESFEILRTFQLIMKFYKFQHFAIEEKFFCSVVIQIEDALG